jgi:nucleoid-associated protein EbfC
VFKGLGDLGGLSGLLRQAMDVKKRVEELKDSLADVQVEASAGGGMVKVVMTGQFEVVSLQIDPEIIDKEEPEMLETMVRAAINEAVGKTQELVKGKMTELTGGIDVPGLTS